MRIYTLHFAPVIFHHFSIHILIVYRSIVNPRPLLCMCVRGQCLAFEINTYSAEEKKMDVVVVYFESIIM